jgi:ATP synthase protein I
MLLAVGLVVGCANAWHWVSEQDEAMHDEAENKDE